LNESKRHQRIPLTIVAGHADKPAELAVEQIGVGYTDDDSVYRHAAKKATT
jgi:hypothetical protein